MNSPKNMTLEDRSLVSVALAIWNSCPKTIRQLVDFYNSTCWSPFQRICARNIETLELPLLIRKHLKVLIKYIGIEVSYLLGYWKKIFNDEEIILHFLSCSRWTAQGVVDIRKTTRTLLMMDAISLKDRYKLACNMCFHVEVAELWEGLTEDERSSFLQIPHVQVEYLELVTIWSLLNTNQYHVLIKLANDCSYDCDAFSQYLLLCAVSCGCVEAVDYFWNEMPFDYDTFENAIYLHDEITSDIMDKSDEICEYAYYSPSICRIRIMVYLFTKLDNESLAHILTSHDENFVGIVDIFLEWPDRERFIKVLDGMQPHLTGVQYGMVVWMVDVKKERYSNFSDGYYREVFMTVWDRLRALEQSKMLDAICEIIYHYCCTNSTFTISRILKDLTPAQKEEMIFSSRGRALCNGNVDYYIWLNILYVVRRCVPSDKLQQFQSLFGKDTQIHLYLDKLIKDKNKHE